MVVMCSAEEDFYLIPPINTPQVLIKVIISRANRHQVHRSLSGRNYSELRLVQHRVAWSGQVMVHRRMYWIINLIYKVLHRTKFRVHFCLIN